ncbi:MAG: 3-hydroxyacyl-ACP dehydratase [Chitinophagales bacterium]|nr:3-hydroxyacyl-ACP dehydratase [Chitinophagaceae bacterium]MCB9064196.1 3-hydroxyacyl-ACP dehydratase [Chitinophagales bacterium]
MLMNDFYRIEYIQREPNSVSCKIAFNTQHDIFKGHFPGQPVVPGVCMMQMVKELLEAQTDQPLWLRNALQVKFLQLITPDVEPLINISWQANDNGYNVNAAFRNDTSDLFKLTGSFEVGVS